MPPPWSRPMFALRASSVLPKQSSDVFLFLFLSTSSQPYSTRSLLWPRLTLQSDAQYWSEHPKIQFTLPSSWIGPFWDKINVTTLRFLYIEIYIPSWPCTEHCVCRICARNILSQACPPSALLSRWLFLSFSHSFSHWLTLSLSLFARLAME